MHVTYTLCFCLIIFIILSSPTCGKHTQKNTKVIFCLVINNTSFFSLVDNSQIKLLFLISNDLQPFTQFFALLSIRFLALSGRFPEVIEQENRYNLAYYQKYKNCLAGLDKRLIWFNILFPVLTARCLWEAHKEDVCPQHLECRNLLLMA